MSDLEGVARPGDLMVGVLLPVHYDKVYQKVSFSEKPPRTICTTVCLLRVVQFQRLSPQSGSVPASVSGTEPLGVDRRWNQTVQRRQTLEPNCLEETDAGTEWLGGDKHWNRTTWRRHTLEPNRLEEMYDTCNVPHYELQGALEFLTESSPLVPNYRCPSRSPFTAVVGSVVSSNSIILANVLGVLKYPQVSPLSTVSLLSNRPVFPSFFRTVASDKFQSDGLAKLVLQFGWTWVGLLAANNDYGQLGIQPIKKEIIKAGGCVAFTETLLLGQPDRNAPHVVKVIKEATATVIIAFVLDVDMVPVMNEMLKQNVNGKLLVGNAGWSKSNLFSMEKYSQVVTGSLLHYLKTLRLTLSSGREIYFDENGDIPATHDIVNWQMSSDGSMHYVEIGTYDSSTLPDPTFTINFSLLRWRMGDSQVPSSVCSQSCPPGFRKAPLQGQPACCYECVPCLQGEISNQTDSIHCMRCPWDQWPNAKRTSCIPKISEFLRFDEPLGAILAAVSIFSSFISASVLKIFMQHKHTPIVKATNYALSCLLLVLLSLCFLCSLVFIGYPQEEKCLVRQTSFGLVFALCVSCILAKTIMVVLAFMATRPGSGLQKWTKPLVSYVCIFICFSIQFILCVYWLSLTPPFPQNNIQTKLGFIIVECNEGSLIAFWTMLGYLFLLATISFIVAFLARRLPDSFNEAQFITFSMLAFLSVWISFIPAYLSAQGKYTVAMEIFAILASSWALIICMFFPKCFIILFRPDMNSKNYIMGKK
ncbi:extracellular calcium-sensing receptor-like [Hyperolius riggenbachi]|uniref:extracellular calcium-sensing receptor-like n=1 Tax=Hyperolius riggenbachi TaxID=752182 RepID=UPI0035A33738